MGSGWGVGESVTLTAARDGLPAMSVPCVRVPRADGEATRERLADLELVDDDHEIVVDEGHLYIPVTDARAVPDDLGVVNRDPPTRETQTMPADLVEFEVSYERIGDVVVIDEDDPERARALADAIVASALPVETVLNRASKVKGDLRVRDWEVLAGETTETVHREYGCEFAVDLAAVYFSPRLATERHRVAEQVESGEQALDMFAGVGPFVVPFAKQGAETVGVDLNETAVEYLRENARRNGVADSVTAIHGDVRDVAVNYEDWADRLVMNLPHSADEFLETAVQLAGDDCVIHYYDIQHEDDPYGPGEAAIRAAAEPAYEVTVENRRTVRSYAPHELNVVLDVRLMRE
jgi:tRNA (guanine37-N1)-methyltransferase